MVAQDTGTAIRGVVRGDIFFGFGDKAGALAGRMKAPGFMAVLLPRALAVRIAGQGASSAPVREASAEDESGSGKRRGSGSASAKRQNFSAGRRP